MIEGVQSLLALAKAREAFLETARHTEANLATSRVLSALEARDYSTGPMIELFVDAALINDKAVVAWLDVALADDELRIRPSLRLLSADGETVHEMAERFATSEEEFAEQLSSASRQLLDAFVKVDFERPEDYFGAS